MGKKELYYVEIRAIQTVRIEKNDVYKAQVLLGLVVLAESKKEALEKAKMRHLLYGIEEGEISGNILTVKKIKGDVWEHTL